MAIITCMEKEGREYVTHHAIRGLRFHFQKVFKIIIIIQDIYLRSDHCKDQKHCNMQCNTKSIT
jgi:hypothetical protein